MSIEESLDVIRIYSVADQLPAGTPLIRHRPFRAPHHTISPAGFVGGGNIPKPGEISLAHRGVLFLDGFPEFGTHVLEVMPPADGRQGCHDQPRKGLINFFSKLREEGQSLMRAATCTARCRDVHEPVQSIGACISPHAKRQAGVHNCGLGGE